MTSPSLPAQTSVESADLLPPDAAPRPKPRKSYGKTARRSAVWDLGSKMTSQAVNMVISLFNFYNAFVDVNGVKELSPEGYEASGKRLSTQGYAPVPANQVRAG